MFPDPETKNDFSQSPHQNHQNCQRKSAATRLSHWLHIDKLEAAVNPFPIDPCSPSPYQSLLLGSTPYQRAPHRPPRLRYHPTRTLKFSPFFREINYLVGYAAPSERLSEIRSTYFKSTLNAKEFRSVFRPKVVAVLNKLFLRVLRLNPRIPMTVFSHFVTILHCYLCRAKPRFSETKLLRTGFVCLWLSLKNWRTGQYLDQLVSGLKSILPDRARISTRDFKKEELNVFSALDFNICFRSHYDKSAGYVYQMFSMDIEFAEDRQDRLDQLAKRRQVVHKKSQFLRKRPKALESFSPEQPWNLSSSQKFWILHKDLDKFKFLKKQLMHWVNFYLKLSSLRPKFVVECSQMLPLACIWSAVCSLQAAISENQRVPSNVVGKRERMEISSDSTYTDFRPVRSSFKSDCVRFLGRRFQVLLKIFEKYKLDLREVKKVVRDIESHREEMSRNERFCSFFQHHMPGSI